MATVCPLCKKGTLKKGEKMVYCTGYQPQKDGKEWFNSGECDFHIPYNQKAFGRVLSNNDMKKLIDGESIRNAKGDVLTLDLSVKGFYTKIDFAERPEDEDF